jgi:hypothetical protein
VRKSCKVFCVGGCGWKIGGDTEAVVMLVFGCIVLLILAVVRWDQDASSWELVGLIIRESRFLGLRWIC